MKVYIVHGWTYSLDKWAPFCEQLRAAGHEPVQLRVPGLTAPSDKVWDMDGYVAWLDGELKGEPAPVVIGHSNGGRIALSYIQRHPGRIQQLILMDSAGVAHQELRSQAKLATLRGLSKLGKPLTKVPYARKLVYKVIGAQDYRNAPPNMKRTMQNMLDANKRIDFKQVDIPVALIWGRDDTQTPLGDGQIMQRELPQASLSVIDGARHAPFFTHTQETVQLVLKALEEN
jgi:pimeloyl-ACP methyl ester carboxylesterase